MREALDGVRSALYVSPHEDNEIQSAASFLRAAEDMGVRVVFAGVHIADEGIRAATIEAMCASTRDSC